MRTVCCSLAILILLVMGPGSAAQAQERIRLAVMPTQFDASAKDKVPGLFDDYLLTAVQNVGDFDVIGQDDINQLLGFEQQKDLMGCDDASCIADIGGALGVDRIIVVKIALLEEDWVVTSKLINIKSTRVDGRSSEFVSGDTRDLLRAVPTVVRNLLSRANLKTNAAPAAAERKQPAADAPAAAAAAAAPAPVAQATTQSYPAASNTEGRVARIVGLIMSIAGFAAGGLGGLVTAMAGLECDGSCDESGEIVAFTYGVIIYGVGLLIGGIGSNVYINGKARGYTNNGEASGRVSWRFLGWLLMGASIAAPLVLAVADMSTLAGLAGLGCVASSVLVFGLSMRSSSAYAILPDGQEITMSGGPIFVRDRAERLVPGLGFAWRF